jgi:hypothetical protein
MLFTEGVPGGHRLERSEGFCGEDIREKSLEVEGGGAESARQTSGQILRHRQNRQGSGQIHQWQAFEVARQQFSS